MSHFYTAAHDCGSERWLRAPAWQIKGPKLYVGLMPAPYCIATSVILITRQARLDQVELAARSLHTVLSAKHLETKDLVPLQLVLPQDCPALLWA